MSTNRLKVTGMDHVVLHVRNLEISERFYIDVLGCELRHRGRPGQPMTFLRVGNQGIDLREVGDVEIYGGKEMNHLALNLEAGERDEIIDVLANFGIEIHGRDENDFETVHFYDPDGHRIQLLAPSEQKFKKDTLYNYSGAANNV